MTAIFILMIILSLFLCIGIKAKETNYPIFLKLFRFFVLSYTIALFFAIDSKAQNIGTKIYEPEQFYTYFQNVNVLNETFYIFNLNDTLKVTSIQVATNIKEITTKENVIVIKLKPLFDTLTENDDNDFNKLFDQLELIDFIVMDRVNYFSYIEQ